MRNNIEYFIAYFGSGYVVKDKIKLSSIVKEYRKLKGERARILIKHKGEDDYEL